MNQPSHAGPLINATRSSSSSSSSSGEDLMLFPKEAPEGSSSSSSLPRVVLSIESDGEFIDLMPPAAARSHRLVVLQLGEYVEGPDGLVAACDTVAGRDRRHPRARGDRERDAGGSLHVVPPFRVGRGGFTIASWIKLPLPKTNAPHALVGGGRGNAFVAADEGGKTIGQLFFCLPLFPNSLFIC